jgi:hypothetical protein
MATTRYISPMSWALVFMGMNETEKVFDWLEKGVESRASLVRYLHLFPFFDPVRHDPRYQALLGRLGHSVQN